MKSEIPVMIYNTKIHVCCDMETDGGGVDCNPTMQCQF